MVLNNKTDEPYPGTDSFIVLTWIQGPPNRWKTFVGNRVVIIQEETTSAMWRRVPSQSNPADLISKGIEPSVLPHHGGRDHTGHHRNYQAGLQQGSLLQTTCKSEMYMLLFYTSRRHYTRFF
jgi:hypothetical protein